MVATFAKVRHAPPRPHPSLETRSSVSGRAVCRARADECGVGVARDYFSMTTARSFYDGRLESCTVRRQLHGMLTICTPHCKAFMRGGQLGTNSCASAHEPLPSNTDYRVAKRVSSIVFFGA